VEKPENSVPKLVDNEKMVEGEAEYSYICGLEELMKSWYEDHRQDHPPVRLEIFRQDP
jgi:hypothetical protein